MRHTHSPGPPHPPISCPLPVSQGTAELVFLAPELSSLFHKIKPDLTAPAGSTDQGFIFPTKPQAPSSTHIDLKPSQTEEQANMPLRTLDAHFSVKKICG